MSWMCTILTREVGAGKEFGRGDWLSMCVNIVIDGSALKFCCHITSLNNCIIYGL